MPSVHSSLENDTMTQTAPYEVLEHNDVIEIRQYPKLILATVGGNDEDSAFGPLFKYISGNNKASYKIAMTTPVISSEKIEMTAPVISDQESISFVLPPNYTLETAPEPLNEQVRIQEVPARKVATIRFRGRAGERSVEEETVMLLAAIKKSGLTSMGQPFLMRYNSPFTPGFMRRNEIGIEVK